LGVYNNKYNIVNYYYRERLNSYIYISIKLDFIKKELIKGFKKKINNNKEIKNSLL